jgi:hypothetical protein
MAAARRETGLIEASKLSLSPEYMQSALDQTVQRRDDGFPPHATIPEGPIIEQDIERSA